MPGLFWAFVVFGVVIIIIFGVGLYSVVPSEWTIPKKTPPLLLFILYLLYFLGLFYFGIFYKFLFKKSAPSSAK
jgi:hypothetical protein